MHSCDARVEKTLGVRVHETKPLMLNGALDNASLHLAQSQGFKDGLCHCAD